MNDFTSYERSLELLKHTVHSPIDLSKYNSTLVMNSTNCYSHALGSTLACLQLYRIGAICRKKDINEDYFSIQEIIDLLYEDVHTLDLQIEESFLNSSINYKNQYQIALFVKIYADKKIHDYHFYRYDELYGWSEKWRGLKPTFFESFKMLNYFPWNFVGIYTITK